MNEMSQLLQRYHIYISKCQLYTTNEYSNWKYVLNCHEGDVTFSYIQCQLPGQKMPMPGKTASVYMYSSSTAQTGLCVK